MGLVFAATSLPLVTMAVAACLIGGGYPPTVRTAWAVLLLAAPQVAGIWLAVLFQSLVLRRAGAFLRAAAVVLGATVIAIPLGAAAFVVQHIATYPEPFPFTFSESGLYVLMWSSLVALYLYTSDLQLYLPWTPLAVLVVAALRARGGRR
ncbi:hypothetical protein [Lutibaculum baratangense]|uniref:Uncharacterized protein n=1 Tax=Lutibaculum baratangense AMV1 TaxID=631454 RepID=V4RGR4_9HYPH|nr:hypothetical protein [Lutibaculum baratangense]ESR22455.1 hypothetical protein N177_4185 [Lutibaculum baratangense AMV1]